MLQRHELPTENDGIRSVRLQHGRDHLLRRISTGITTTAYDAVLRPTLVTSPTGATTAMTYSDGSLQSTQTVQLPDADHTIVSETFTQLNGRGQPVYSKYLADATHWNATSVQYDVMGRKQFVSLPYDSASVPDPMPGTTYTYDALSRVTQVTAPDGSTSKTFYNETGARPDSASASLGQTVRTQDAWGRERWARTDDFGRLVEVVEPNPTGDGTVAAAGSLKTSYGYDQLDQLLTVTQGSQTRSFKYDSLGRLTRQKLAEQTATINDAGTYVGVGGTGALWSDAFTYDARSNITKRIDARGVETDFSYQISGNTDPLNRLQSISYDTSTADTTYTINAAPSVTLSYMTTGDQTRVSSVVTAGVSTETNGYDTEGRISDYTLTLANRSSYPMQTSYAYDTANRLTQITYPAQYGIAGSPRKTVTPSYDQASRLTQMAVNGQTQLSGLQYNAFGQVTQLTTGNPTGTTDATENYGYDSATGLLTSQTVTRTSDSTTLLNLSYGYARGNSNGNLSGKTGQLTSITNNLDHNKDRSFEFDALGRLKAAKGGLAAGATGVTANWTQTYAYDRYGNKTSVTATGITADSSAVPTDGIPSLTYDQPSNRINTSGYTYDNAGNMIRGQSAAGTWVNFEYDAAGRLVKVLDDAAPTHNVLETYTYGADRSRLANATASQTTYYAWGGSSVIQEYTEATGTTNPVYSKAYVYAGSRLLSTAINISGSELVEFHHPDRLGTKVVTNPSANTSYEKSSLPFGTELLGEESGIVSTNQRFTSYDRSNSTGLDYAVNRIYSSGQGRFTQVDPIGMGAASTGNPQSLNLYSYTQNNPVDFVDPSGLNEEAPLFNEHVWTYSDSFIRFLWFIMTGGGGGPQGSVEHSGGGGGGGLEHAHAQTQQNNPNCITNAVPNSRVGNSRTIMAGGLMSYGPDGKPVPPYGTDTSTNSHDGIHIGAPNGTPDVTALPAMTGRVLHYGFQVNGSAEDRSILDIRLNIAVRGDPLVLTFKDMFYEKGAYNTRSTISAGQIIGKIQTDGYDSIAEAGLHVTLMTLSTYNRFINGRFSSASRAKVPYNLLMNAATDPKSPFKCP